MPASFSIGSLSIGSLSINSLSIGHLLHSARSKRAASLFSTVTFLTYSGTFLSANAWAQTPQSERTETPERAKSDDLDRKKKELPPAPGNPAVLVDPTNGSGNNTKDYLKDGSRRVKPEISRDYGDHKRRPDDPRAVIDPQDLPLYAYNNFADARRQIEMRRRNIERMLGGYDDLTTSRSKSLDGKNASDRSAMRDKNGRLPDSRMTDKYGKNARDTQDDQDDQDSSTGTKTRRRPSRNDSDDTGDTDDTTTNTKTRRRTTRADSDTRDDNSDSTDDSATQPRRRVRRSTDDDTNSDDSADDATTSKTRRRSTRDDSDTSGDDDTDAANRRRARRNDEDSMDEALSDADLREQRRRKAAGLPPLQTSRKTTRRSSDDNDDSSDDYSSSRSARNSRSQSRGMLDFGPNLPNGGAGQPPANAFNQIIDPLTQLTTNVIASAPTNYQLSGGDQVVVHITLPKLAPRDLTRTIETEGYLNLGDMGRFIVRGKTLDQVQSDLQVQLNRFYKNADVSVSLKELRTIPITVQGEVVMPGGYTLPATGTAINLLYKAGGPTEDGSMREIRVMRQGKQVGTIDLYKFFGAMAQNDIPLQSGDVLVVPPNGSRVAISGEVRHAAQYELKPGETLKDVLAFAGGVKAAGVDQIVQLNTIEPGQNRVLKNVNLRDTAAVSSLKLYDGDAVEIHSVRQIVENKVTIKGAVSQPSDYALVPGMRVTDLLRMARNPLSEAFLGRAALKRWNSDNTTTLIPVDLARAIEGDQTQNLPLMKWDTLEVFSQAEASFVGTRKIEVRGSVQRPGVYEYSQNMRVSDILLRAGGPLPNAERIEIIHQHGDGTYGLDPVLVADIAHGDKSRDIGLQDNDVVAVYSNRQAAFQSEHLVRIEGDVNTPGFYPRAEGMKLTDLLRLSGSFKPGANPKVVIAHARRSVDSPDNNTIVSVKFDNRQQCAPQDDVRLEDGDIVAVQGTGGIEDRPAVVRVIGAVNTPGPIILKNKRQRLSDAIAEAGGLRPEAFPEGAEFNRDPQNLNSKTQRALALNVSELNSLLNDSELNGARAKSDIDRIKALGNADSGGSLIGGAQTSSVGNTAAGQTIAQELSKHSLVTAPRRLTDKELDPSGNIAINLPAALDEAKRKVPGVDDILLKDGDTIIVPETPTTIQVVGAVTNQRGVLYSPNKTLEFYVAQAGGFTPDSAKDRIVIIHAGGGIIEAKKARELRPGDVILVPTKVLVQKISENRNGFGDFFKSLTSSAILFRVSTGLLGL